MSRISPEELASTHGLIRLADLRPLEGNAHRADREALRKSLDEFGQFESIAVWNGEVLIGNHRVEEAIELGWENLAGYDLSPFDLDQAERIARALASNRIAQLGSEDETLLAALLDSIAEPTLIAAAGFDDEFLAALLDGTGGSGGGSDPNYTRKVVGPVYEPTGERPAVEDLVDRSKTLDLVAEIDAADEIPDDVREFLRVAAERHTEFRFDRIAEYYAHADAAVQDLMERSVLVIVDFDRAIELGFVSLSSRLAEQHDVDVDDPDLIVDR